MTAFVAERICRGVGIDTGVCAPKLHAYARRLLEEPAFKATEP